MITIEIEQEEDGRFALVEALRQTAPKTDEDNALYSEWQLTSGIIPREVDQIASNMD